MKLLARLLDGRTVEETPTRADLLGAIKQHRNTQLGVLEKIGPAARIAKHDAALYRAAGLAD